MAGVSLLTLIDDIATLLDDVSVMTKVAAKKTAGVLGDDLALNAQQVTGVNAQRELPVIWAVAKGSMLNKAILVPLALVLSVWLAWIIPILLIIGGAYLCYEGFEKIAHKLLHKNSETQENKKLITVLQDEKIDIVQFEKEKIKWAIRTDFVLSAEIIVIALGVVAQATLSKQIITLTGIAILMTVGVYGLVGLIVKLDDIGLWLQKSKNKLNQQIGNFCLWLMPKLMHALAFFGTLAMFLVGGSIVVHNLPHFFGIHYLYDLFADNSAKDFIAPVLDTILGVIIGAITLFLVFLVTKIKELFK